MGIIANIGDLHLYNRNIRSTLTMPESSTSMLEELYFEVMEHEEIDILNSLGDIQHLVPQGKTALKYTDEWTEQFIQIGIEMTKRFNPERFKVVGRDGSDINARILNGECFAFFAIKGNHDFDSEVDFTYYDLLVKQGVICEPLYILDLEENVQINYHHYHEAHMQIPRQEGVQKVVGLYHDNIDYPEMPFWMGLNENGYKAVEIFNDVDVAIIGHIHKNYDPVWITTDNGTQCLVYVQGAMGRTQFADGQIRDVGYVSVVNTSDTTQIGTLEVKLTPKEQYFNYREAIVRQEQRRDYSQFTLNISAVQANTTDVRDEVRALDIDADVKELGIRYLTEVLEGAI